MEKRLGYIDGIRGIASIMVVFCHLSCAFMPWYYKTTPESTVFSKFFLASPLNALTNGHTAVNIFFVLSGFLIARKMYCKSEESIISPFFQYTKLLRVVMPAVILAALLMLGGMFHLKAVSLDSRLAFVRSYNNFEPRLFGVLSDIFYRTFRDASSYVGPLWTIKHEFVGSVLIGPIAFYASKKPLIGKSIYLLIFIVFRYCLPGKMLVPFVFGALAYDCIAHIDEDTSFFGRWIRRVMSNKTLCVVLVVVGGYLACVNRTLDGVYFMFSNPLSQRWLGGCNIISPLGFAIFLVGLESIGVLKTLLSSRLLLWFGKISAYTYAFHWQVILSVGCGIFILLNGRVGYSLSICIVSMVVFLNTFLIAWIWSLAVSWIEKRRYFGIWTTFQKSA